MEDVKEYKVKLNEISKKLDLEMVKIKRRGKRERLLIVTMGIGITAVLCKVVDTINERA